MGHAVTPSGGRSWSDIHKVVCVDMIYMGEGDVVGSGSKRLVIARQNQNHFVPLIACRSQRVFFERGSAMSAEATASSSASSSALRKGRTGLLLRDHALTNKRRRDSSNADK